MVRGNNSTILTGWNDSLSVSIIPLILRLINISITASEIKQYSKLIKCFPQSPYGWSSIKTKSPVTKVKVYNYNSR